MKDAKEGAQASLDIEGETVNAMVKNIDYDPMSKKVLALDFQALVAGEKVSTTVAVKLEHTDMVQGIVEQEMEEIHYKADPSNLLDTIVIDFNGYPAHVRDIQDVYKRQESCLDARRAPFFSESTHMLRNFRIRNSFPL